MKKVTVLFICAAMLGLSGCDYWKQMQQDAKIETNTVYSENEEQSSDSALVMRIGVAGRDTFNSIVSQSETLRRSMEYVYEPLFRTDAAMRCVGVLAETASRSDDGKTVAVKLREGVKWHDGAEFTSADVVYTINAILGRSTAYSIPCATGAAAADKFNVRIYFSEPVINPSSLLTFPIIKNGTPLDTNSSYTPVGTGEYCYDKKVSINEHGFLRFGEARSSDYRFAGLKIIEVSSRDELRNMFLAGETDCFYADEEEIAFFNSGNGSLREIITDKMVYLGVNAADDVLGDSRVRKAVSRVLDRQALVNSLLYKKGIPADTPVNPWAWVYEGYGSGVLYSIDESEELMTAAGWSNDGSGLFEKSENGTKASFTIMVNKDNEIHMRAGELIADRLGKYGFKADMIELGEEIYTQRVNNGSYDMYIGECNVGLNMDISKIIETAKSGGYENAVLNDKINQLKKEDDPGQIGVLFAECTDIFREDMPVIPLYFKNRGVFSGMRMKGYMN